MLIGRVSPFTDVTAADVMAKAIRGVFGEGSGGKTDSALANWLHQTDLEPRT